MEILIIVLLYVVTFFLGASAGSFALVIVRRSHNKENGSWVTGKSVCESCKKTLKWWELIPFVSYLVLRGKCSKCKEKIDPSHFFCETSVGVAYVILLWTFLTGRVDMYEALVLVVAHTILIALSFGDILYREIQVIPVYVLGMIAAVYNGITSEKYYMIAVVAALFVISFFIGRKDNFFTLGAGDIDVAIAIFALTFSGFAFLDMLMYGAVVGIVLALTVLRRKDTGIPFVPCMYIGYVISACGVSAMTAIYNLVTQILSLK